MNLGIIDLGNGTFLQMGAPATTTTTTTQRIIMPGLTLPQQQQQGRVQKRSRTKKINAPLQLFSNGELTTVSPASSAPPVFQIINPISTGMVVNYVIDQNGSHLPVIDTLPVGIQGEHFMTLVPNTEPEPPEEPQTPSHILDHMYAKKIKDPLKSPAPRKRRRVKKKEPPPILSNDMIVHETIESAKVNSFNRSKFVTAATMPSINLTQYRPVHTRPNILQNVRGSGSSPPMLNSPTPVVTAVSTPNYAPGKRKLPDNIALQQQVSSNAVYLISSNNSGEVKTEVPTPTNAVLTKEKDGEFCYMLTSEPPETDNHSDETVITLAPHETQEGDFPTEFSVSVSQDNDDQQHQVSGTGTFLLDDQQIFFSY